MAVNGKGRLFVYLGTPKSNRKLLARIIQTATRMPEIVKYTTRSRRDGEIHGVDNHFLSDVEFDAMEAAGDFVDVSVNFDGKRFGTPGLDVQRLLDYGSTAFMTTSAPLPRLQAAFPEAVLRIFVFSGRDWYRKQWEARGYGRLAIIEKLKEYDRRVAYRDQCEHAIPGEDIGRATSAMMEIFRTYKQVG